MQAADLSSEKIFLVALSVLGFVILTVGVCIGYYVGIWVGQKPIPRVRFVYVSNRESKVFHLSACSAFPEVQDSRKLRVCKFCDKKVKYYREKDC